MASKSNDTESDHNIMQEDILAAPVSVDWQRGESVGACLLEMYERGLWTDVRFRCKDEEDGKSIKAHKVVLAARSRVFQAMFFGTCADGKDEVELKDTEKEIFLLLLKYIYSDTVELNEETALAVLEMAHFYQISSLVEFCVDYLAIVISPDNACRILTSAMMYELTSLRDKCCSFIDNHAEETLKSESFLDLPEECLLHILKGDTLYADEGVILEAAESWAKKKLSERGEEESGANIRRVLGKSFYQLRLPTMTCESLLIHTGRKGYFSMEEYTDIAEFSNKMPNVKVSTNSCVARVPEQETIQIDAQDEIINDGINSFFELSGFKDVALENIALHKITPYDPAEYWRPSGQNTRYVSKNEKFVFESFFPYEDTAIKVSPFTNRYGIEKYSVDFLSPLKGVLSSNPGIVLSGNIRINCLNRNKSFKLLQHENGMVKFTPPLILKRRNDPYRVDIDIRYDGGYKLQMKTTCKKSNETISNRAGTINIVSSYGGYFAGIKSIGFLNVSNRDKDMDLETKEQNV